MTWTEWKGGECPVEPETVVEVKFGDGSRSAYKARAFGWDKRDMNAWRIVAYRVAEPVASTIPEKPFSTRITEAEEKALEAVDFIHGVLNDLEGSAILAREYDASPALRAATMQIVAARTAIFTAAALARDYARKEG